MPGCKEKAAGCRCYFSFYPNRYISSHRRWRQGWRQCLSEKDSRPDSSDHDTRSEGAKIIKNSTGLCPKTVVREPVLFSQKLIKKFGNCREKSKTPHLSMRSLVGEGGFEPPKSLTADLQSVPFGHSGIPPYSECCVAVKWSW